MSCTHHGGAVIVPNGQVIAGVDEVIVGHTLRHGSGYRIRVKGSLSGVESTVWSSLLRSLAHRQRRTHLVLVVMHDGRQVAGEVREGVNVAGHQATFGE